MVTTVEQLFERIRDAFGTPEELLEALDISYQDLLDILYEQGHLNEGAIPFVFNLEDSFDQEFANKEAKPEQEG